MSAYPELKPCSRCLTPMRPSRRKAGEYPFKTLVAQTSTLCGSCHQRDLRGTRPKPAPKPEPVITDKPQANTIAGLARFLEQRHRRLRAGATPIR